MIKTLVIDDEAHIRALIIRFLEERCQELKIVGQAGTVSEGLQLIHQQNPDLILLDVKMPDGTGFDLLAKTGTEDFKVIFVTAFEEYAVKAFQFSAVDYILKPVDPNELIQAVSKAKFTLQAELTLKLNSLLNNVSSSGPDDKKILLKTSDNIYLVKVHEIVNLESEQNYTAFYLADGKKLIMSRTLKDYEDMLNGYGFYRVHKSHLINFRHIDRFEKTDGGNVIMANGFRIPVASRKKDELLDLLDKL